MQSVQGLLGAILAQRLGVEKIMGRRRTFWSLKPPTHHHMTMGYSWRETVEPDVEVELRLVVEVGFEDWPEQGDAITLQTLGVCSNHHIGMGRSSLGSGILANVAKQGPNFRCNVRYGRAFIPTAPCRARVSDIVLSSPIREANTSYPVTTVVEKLLQNVTNLRHRFGRQC